MTSDIQIVRDLLREHDPTLRQESIDHEEVVLSLLLEKGLDDPRKRAKSARVRTRSFPRLAIVVAVPVAVLTALFAVGIYGTSERTTAYASTPSPLQLPAGSGVDATNELLRLAAAAEAAPSPQRDEYRYSRIRAWYLNSSVQDDSVTSELEPRVTERWLAADGSVTAETSRGGETKSSRFDTGPKAELLSRLSTEPAQLRQQLLGYPNVGQDNGGIPNDAERTVNAIELLRDFAPIPASLQGTLWRVLSREGLSYHGKITDRGGRRGAAFTLQTNHSGLPTEYLLIIDPNSGRLLSFENVLTESAGKLNVRTPSVLEYEIFEAADFVGRAGDKPTGS